MRHLADLRGVVTPYDSHGGGRNLKLHMAVRWLIGGKVDHIPATIFADYPKLVRAHDAVRDHPGVKS